jgi:hypothetical protein
MTTKTTQERCASPICRRIFSHHGGDESFRPTALIAKIADELGKAVEPVSQREVLELVRGKDQTKREEFARFIAEGCITSKTPQVPQIFAETEPQ